MKPLVSIGIPCFNSACWLGAAIESALAQTWSATEVIVVDDGSTDDSAALARSFGGRVRLLVADHRGGNHARNSAAQAARGEWLQFLDADDYLREHGQPLRTLPFIGAIYNAETGENDSGMCLRGWKSLKMFIKKLLYTRPLTRSIRRDFGLYELD